MLVLLEREFNLVQLDITSDCCFLLQMRLEGMNSHNNMLINTRMQTHARPRDTLYEENIPQMLDDAAVPDLMAEDPVPDLLHGLSFGEGF